jgi:DNA invertase Pin-like site-specific DNA recombinase
MLTTIQRQPKLTVMTAMSSLQRDVRRSEPEAALRALARLRRMVDQLEADQVRRARRAGRSWQEIATCLGVTKQTVHRKYRRIEED